MKSLSIKKLLFYMLITAGIYLFSFTGISQAQDLPLFRQGMWEFNRTIENTNSTGNPQTMKNNKCTNPTDDMKKQREMLSKLGCKVSSVSRTDKTYSFTADCKIQNTSVQSKSIMTVENDAAYSIHVESQSGDQSTKELLQAKRTGDCAKDK